MPGSSRWGVRQQLHKEIPVKSFGNDLGLVHEAVVTGRKVGAGKCFWTALAHSEELFEKVVALVVATLKITFLVRSTFDDDERKYRYPNTPANLEKDSPFLGGVFTPVLANPFNPVETSVMGSEWEKRAKQYKDHSGQRELEAMLREQDKIPIEWQGYRLVGSATVWNDGNSRHYNGLMFDGGRWCFRRFLICEYITQSFESNCRMVRHGKLPE